MKVIDLLNKIANGEIKEDTIIEFDNGYKDYCSVRVFFDRYIVDRENLNTEIEIIEENKKIEKLCQTLNRLDIGDDYYRYIMENRFKINEIIDYLEENK